MHEIKGKLMIEVLPTKKQILPQRRWFCGTVASGPVWVRKSHTRWSKVIIDHVSFFIVWVRIRSHSTGEMGVSSHIKYGAQISLKGFQNNLHLCLCKNMKMVSSLIDNIDVRSGPFQQQ